MSSYAGLARWYDELTADVPYEEIADFYEAAFSEHSRPVHTVLDFCCGTGAMTGILARRGYDMTATDASSDMLAEAAAKLSQLSFAEPPLLLCQEASQLDLNDTVDAAVCCLDSINYLPPEELDAVFARLALFVSPGGLLIFDINSPERLRSLDGGTFVDEREGLLCLWRAQIDEQLQALVYGVDLFSQRGRLWSREQEEHVEYIHEPEQLLRHLEQAGFVHAVRRTDGPQHELGREFYIAERKL